MHTVLIADDERNIRHILDFSLHAEGFDVLSAHTGEDALAMALEHRPDLIILDIMMPGKGGIETCRALKTDPQTAAIPVVLLSARSSQADREAGEEGGRND